MPQGYTYDELVKLGAKPADEPKSDGYTLEQLQSMGAKPGIVDQATQAILKQQAAKYPTNAEQGIGIGKPAKPVESGLGWRILDAIGNTQKPQGTLNPYAPSLAESMVGNSVKAPSGMTRMLDAFVHGPMVPDSIGNALAPEKLMLRAANNRAKISETLPVSTTPMALAKSAMDATRRPRAFLQEAAARAIADTPKDLPYASAAQELTHPPMTIESSPRSTQAMRKAAEDEKLRSTLWDKTESAPEMPATEKIPYPGQPKFVEQELKNARIADIPEMEYSGDLKAPTTPRGPLPFEATPEMLQPAKLSLDQQIRNIEQAIKPSGGISQRSTLNNAPKLLEVAPELGALKDPKQFDPALIKTFRRVESDVDEAEKAIPRDTLVPKKDIREGLSDLAQQYADIGDTNAAHKLGVELQKWDELPEGIPWPTFRDMKRRLGNEMKTSWMRKAYGVLMNASNQVSDELKVVNARYSIVRRAIDDAKIDLKTGRRIKEVGKVQMSPLVQDEIKRMAQKKKAL